MDVKQEYMEPVRRVMSLIGDGPPVHLVALQDGRLGIVLGQMLHGTWDAADEEACIAEFTRLGNCQSDPCTVLVMNRMHPHTASMN